MGRLVSRGMLAVWQADWESVLEWARASFLRAVELGRLVPASHLAAYAVGVLVLLFILTYLALSLCRAVRTCCCEYCCGCCAEQGGHSGGYSEDERMRLAPYDAYPYDGHPYNGHGGPSSGVADGLAMTSMYAGEAHQGWMAAGGAASTNVASWRAPASMFVRGAGGSGYGPVAAHDDVAF